MARGDTFTTVRSLGGLLPSDLLQRVADLDRNLDGLSPADYGLGAGERLREAIARSWSRLTGVWDGFRAELDRLPESDRATSLTRERWLLILLQELGFGRVHTATADEIGGSSYAISHGWEAVPIHLLGWRIDIERRTEGVAGAATMSPHALVQEYLNRSDDHLWALVSNGRVLRLLRDNLSMSRQAFVEFDLEAMFDGEVYADFVLLWLLCHATRFEGGRPEECHLEGWVTIAHEEGTRALEKLRDGVEEALKTLGTGLLSHPANAALRHRVESGDLTSGDLYRQLLRVIYRMLFLFVAEDRQLLLWPGEEHAKARERYERWYSTQALRNLARQQAGGRHDDRWDLLTRVFFLVGSDDGCDELALPPLGSGLWDTELTGDVVGRPGAPTRIRNGALLDVIRHLAWTVEGGMARAVDYRNLGAEELGSVYEALLELHPEVSVTNADFTLRALTGNERKTTGSYYTPTSLITELLNTALDPVLQEALEAEDAESAILDLTVCDPACGSGHFLVAAGHRLARALASVRTGNREPPPLEVQQALRDVVSHCIYGVDMNPMAVELVKVSLWLECHVPGQPLTFLDHHIKCGDSIIGVHSPELIEWYPEASKAAEQRGIYDAAFKALHGDDKSAVKKAKSRNKTLRSAKHGKGALVLSFDEPSTSGHETVAELAGAAARLRDMEDGSLAAQRRKRQTWRELEQSAELARERLRADAWCASFTCEKTATTIRERAQHPWDVYYSLSSGQDLPPENQGVVAVAHERDRYRFFHWYIEFPDVHERGGFDLLLGNPPWERVKIQEKEWFASRAPDIADAANKAKRTQLIKELYDADQGSWQRRLADEWDIAQHEAAAKSHFFRSSDAFPLGGVGDVNIYAVFADLFRQLVSPRGQAGLICPTGLAVGATYADFFGHLVESRSLASFYSFENENKVFPDVHNETKFALVTLTGSDRPAETIGFTGYVRQASEIHDPGRRYELTADEIEAINPNTLTAPLFRYARDADVTAKIHRKVSVLVRDGDPSGNPWDVDFLSMFHMANDAHLFVTEAEARERGGELNGAVFELPDGGRLLPLYEGKMIWHYDHRYGTYEGQTQKQANKGVLPHVTDRQHADPDFSILHRYWVPEQLVDEALEGRWDRDWMIGFRDVGPSERTMVCAVIPRAASGNKTPLLFPSQTGVGEAAVLYSVLASFPVDYALRQKTAGGMSFFIVKQAPVVRPEVVGGDVPWGGETVLKFVLPRAVELTYTARDLAAFAEDTGLGGTPFRWDAERRPVLQAEIDALMFHLYGLERDDVDWVLDSFTVFRKYEERPPERGGVGEYRTKRLVLELYDEMAKAVESGEPYETRLDPLPADSALRA